MHGIRLGTYTAGSAMAPHFHDESSFTIVLQGSYHERILGRSIEHKASSMLSYPAGETHSQQFGQAGAHKLIFRPSSSCLDFLTDERVHLRQAPFAASGSLKTLANRIVGEMLNADSFSPMVVEGTLLELIATFGRMYETEKRPVAIPSWLKQCREMLEAQPRVAATHKVLAARVNKHPVHIAKAFRNAYGETIGECQRRLRLNQAESLLRRRDMPLADVALECGYANQAHFSRSARFRSERL